MKQDRSLYYADDKDIADVLASAKKRLPDARLLELARRRGIILSERTTRDQLIDYISTLGFNWPQLSELMQMIESAARAPKEMTTRIDTSASFEQVTTVTQEVGTRRANLRERHVVTLAGSHLIKLKVEYSEFDESWTRLRQQVDRDMELRIECMSGTLAVRHPTTPRAEEIVETLRLLLEEKTKEVTQRKTLSLSAFDVAERTQFFLDLFNLPGFRVADVVRVRVARPADDSVKIGLRGDEDEDEDEGEGEEDVQFTGLVRQVTLDGKQLTATREYQELIKRGACINNAIWRVVSEPGGDSQYELMAGFGNAYNATRFHYAVRMTWDFNKGRGELNKTGRSPYETERTNMAKVLEDSAQKVAKSMLSKSKTGASATGATSATPTALASTPPTAGSARTALMPTPGSVRPAPTPTPGSVRPRGGKT